MNLHVEDKANGAEDKHPENHCKEVLLVLMALEVAKNLSNDEEKLK